MKIFDILKERCQAKSPKIFQWILRTSLAVSGVALAINTALMAGGAIMPLWWSLVYPYLIGVGAGAAAVAKLTREDAELKNNDNAIN